MCIRDSSRAELRNLKEISRVLIIFFLSVGATSLILVKINSPLNFKAPSPHEIWLTWTRTNMAGGGASVTQIWLAAARWLPPVVKFCKTVSVSKVMVSIFWDSEGVLLTDCFEKGKTVTGVHYAGLVGKLQRSFKFGIRINLGKSHLTDEKYPHMERGQGQGPNF